jgi:hypothetical protein
VEPATVVEMIGPLTGSCEVGGETVSRAATQACISKRSAKQPTTIFDFMVSLLRFHPFWQDESPADKVPNLIFT